MAYYRVKNGGTATGDAGRSATVGSGSFATLGSANYYNDIEDAIENSTTSPIGGDIIQVSDLHDHTYSGSESLSGTTPIPIYCIAVDDANINQGRTSGNFAKESVGSGSFFSMNGIFYSGIEFNAEDDQSFTKTTIMQDSILNASTFNAKAISINGDGTSFTGIGIEVIFGTTSGNVTSIFSGGTLNLVNLTTTGAADNFVNGTFGGGGGAIYVKGSDISSITGTIIANVGASEVAVDAIDVRFDNVKIASGVAFTNETFKSYNQRALFTRCSDSSAAAEYQYHLHAFGGDVDDDSAIFRNESPAFTDSNQKISYKIVTNSDASLGSPLWFDIPLSMWAKLSIMSSDTLRFYVTSDTVLNDKDIYFDVIYPDFTNKQTPNFLTSAPATVGGTLDLMAAGTTLTTDGASTWTGGLANKYLVNMDTSVNKGADCYPRLKVYCTNPSITINLSMDFDAL